MKQYVSPKVEFVGFENDISMSANNSQSCNCQAEQYNNNTSLQEGCELTSYSFNEIGDFY